MPDITIKRHGDRWAVHEADAESPTKEFESREAAELAARDLAAGGAVEIREEDSSDLGRSGSADGPETGLDQVDAVSARERARSPQTGL
jgi:Uncharacterized protein conserved in bacteria (DUF2188)